MGFGHCRRFCFSYFVFILGLFFSSGFLIQAQTKQKNAVITPSVNWLSFAEAIELHTETPEKQILIYFKSKDCHDCAVILQQTLQNPLIARYINEYFFPVLMDVATFDTIEFREQLFSRTSYEKKTTYHDLAVFLSKGKVKLTASNVPTMVVLNYNNDEAIPTTAYKNPVDMMRLLRYFGQFYYKTYNWADFQRTN